jgi:serine/threonine-protein kinase HipA
VPHAINQEVSVAIGEARLPLGVLHYAKQGARESSAFAYAPDWLKAPERFAVSPDLSLIAARQFKKASTPRDSVFHGALADAEPDGWGRRLIARAHAKRRARGGVPAPDLLNALDYLLAVDDESRVGALRFDTVEPPPPRASGIPPLIDLARLLDASRAVERGDETTADLRYLQGKGTSLGGMRPKCSVRDEDGALAIAKFPSVADERAVTRGEVLALQLASRAGIDAAASRVVMCGKTPVALIRRFDRTPLGRIPYLSAASLLQAARDDERSYAEIAVQLLIHGERPEHDLPELWRRMVFNLLITNVDDHLQNHAVLHAGGGKWRLAPAYDLNPMPDKLRELKTWLSMEAGPLSRIDDAVAEAGLFRLTAQQARQQLSKMCSAIKGWKRLAASAAVGMTSAEMHAFEPAFAHAEFKRAQALATG